MKEETPDKITAEEYLHSQTFYSYETECNITFPESALKALSIKESEHQEQLKEIRGILQVNYDHYNISQNREYCKGIKDSIRVLDKYIKG